MSHTAVIGQSGGPTVVINQSLVGCIEALTRSGKMGRVLGAVHGVRGITENRFVELQGLDAQRLERLAGTPSAALGSSRDKPDEEYCRKILAAFEKNDVRYFFYIGGNDSSDTCRIVSEMAEKAGYELHAFHVPKTIDNDLRMNDHTPGFPSAAKFVAHAFIGDNLDSRSLPGVKINVVMGRHAGFLTAASCMARQHPDDGPHLIYVPEVAFDLDAFVADVERVYKKLGRCLVAVSEGVHDEQGTPIVTKLMQGVERDAHGNVQLSGTGALGDHLAAMLKSKLGAKLRVRADTFGYLQRCFPEVVSPVDAKEAREVAHEAVKLALAGQPSGSVAIKRTSQTPYASAYERVDFKEVAAKTRTMEAELLAGTNDVTEACRDYLRPLLGPLPVVEQLDLRAASPASR